MARPTKYKPEYAGQAYKLCLLGATDAQIGKFFHTTERTINRWKRQFPAFCQSINEGKEQADAKVAESLYHRALGYSHPEDRIFLHEGKPVVVPTVKHYPPDATSCIFWLKNRTARRDAPWRDKHDVEHTGKVIERIERVIVDERPQAGGNLGPLIEVDESDKHGNALYSVKQLTH